MAASPRGRESGDRRGQRLAGQGRRHVRRALYLAALAALPPTGAVIRDRKRLGPT
ncbi:MAG: hypothetical protein D6832_01385 [Alphaproteobacteria bacterium]|nr:MAG: hypothetical protein D6832_01385 [Alphaproteobacteria bacterium]